MRKIFLAGSVGVLALLLLVMAGCSSNQAELDKLKADNQRLTEQNKQLKALAGPPPASLDQYLPPNSPAPVYLVEMFNLSGPFGGIGASLQEGDVAGAKASFDAFKTQYEKVSKMVPEWSSQFPAEPVDALGKAIDGGNPAQIGPAMGKVGEVCGSCHLVNMVKVQQKYHWKNFDDVRVTDPISNQELDWLNYMMALEGTYSGTLNSLGRGQLDKAAQSWQAFQTQYETLAKEGCKQCHQDQTGKEIPRGHFVDTNSMAMINQLGEALAATPSDAATIESLAGAIGNEVCMKCHWVHFPAQHAKETWEQFEGILK